MRKARKILWAIFFLLPFFITSSGNVAAATVDDEDETPDVTARVARISFLRGEAKIKHADDSDWERATQNLPLVEGDEISTDANTRLEIQFNRDNYLRLSENSRLKITTLRDEGIAVSLPEGKLSLRVLSFNRERESFEIDAPRTTVAVQQAGLYRVDAGDKRDSQIRVSATDGGQARVYTENAGFSLRSGRAAEIQIAGNYAGEYETADAAKYADEFDAWALERDAVVAKLLQNAYYDKYYDADVYGAEDLSDYGEWIYTKKYGYVWKPYRSATSSYANWSPYRYGHWRFIPPYGWTWVNDEPWGYATYHHGRWIYVDNDWAWTPYGQQRTGRNWWRPALVVVTYSGSLICWYPLPYNYGYYNYNSVYVDRRRYNRTIINNTTVIVNQPAPTNNKKRRILNGQPVESVVPQIGVVAVETNEFGKRARNIRPVPVEIANKVLSKTPFENEAPPLPEYRQVKSKLGREILAEAPRNESFRTQIKTGATERTSGVPVDENLRKERIYGNRQPVEKTPPSRETQEIPGKPETRDTGAVKRMPHEIFNQEDRNEKPDKSVRREIPSDNTFPTHSRSEKTGNNSGESPVSKPQNRVRETPPDYSPQPEPERRERRERQREIAPPETQRSEPPAKREEPRQPKPPQSEKPAPKEERKAAPPPEKSDTGRPEKIKPGRDTR